MSAAIDTLAAAIASASDEVENVEKDTREEIAAGRAAQAELDRAKTKLAELVEAKAVLEREARGCLVEVPADE